MSRFPPPSVAAACVCALAVAACGSSGPPSHSSSATASLANQDVAYSQCMRSHQVPTFPDPERGGGFPKNQLTHLAANNPQFQVAQGACQQLMPNHVEAGPSPAEVQQALNGMVRFAACMRSDRVRNWPDPQVDRSDPSDPRPVFELANRIDPNASGIRADIHGCQHLMPQPVTPYMCSRALAPSGSQPGDEGCTGGSPSVP